VLFLLSASFLISGFTLIKTSVFISDDLKYAKMGGLKDVTTMSAPIIIKMIGFSSLRCTFMRDTRAKILKKKR
jgi:hypothetical protein